MESDNCETFAKVSEMVKSWKISKFYEKKIFEEKKVFILLQGIFYNIGGQILC